LELLRQNLAKQTNDFRDIEEQFAFAIWFVEKEFNVGPITDEFPLMKFFNLLDEGNLKKYEEVNKTNTPSSFSP